MTQSVGDGEFLLPSHFFNDDDEVLTMDNKEDIDQNDVKATELKLAIDFPTEFPYEFSSNSDLSSPGESVHGSTEAETESDEEDFLAALTRELTRSSFQETQNLPTPKYDAPKNLEKLWVESSSPQSTLSGIRGWSGRSADSGDGSPNGPSLISSPKTTPLDEVENNAWNFIYAAAGQVARLKMSGEGPPLKYQHGRGLLSGPRNPLQVSIPPVKNNSSVFYTDESFTYNSLSQRNQQVKHDLVMNQQERELTSVWGNQAKEGWFSQQNKCQIGNRGGYENGRCGRPLGLPQSAWPPLQVQHQNQHHRQQPPPPPQNGSGMRAVFLGGSGVKRECTGTGVFLPRRYNNPTESRKNSGCSTVLLPARVVQALNLNLEEMSAHPQPRFHGGFTPNHDAMMARRNALFTQHKRSFRPEGELNHHEISLPQEWTY